MVEPLLKSIQPEITITPLVQNDDYGFEVKHAFSKSLNYQLIFTDGLSSKTQPVTDGYAEYQKIELYFLLPDFWKIQDIDWPLHWINRLAEVPQKNNTWFGPGDTIPAGNPPEILSDRFPANHFMLVNPIEATPILAHESILNAGIRFFGILPICQPELDYKIRNSWSVLLARLQKKGHSEKVDLFRSSVCRKRFLGF